MNAIVNNAGNVNKMKTKIYAIWDDIHFTDVELPSSGMTHWWRILAKERWSTRPWQVTSLWWSYSQVAWQVRL